MPLLRCLGCREGYPLRGGYLACAGSSSLLVAREGLGRVVWRVSERLGAWEVGAGEEELVVEDQLWGTLERWRAAGRGAIALVDQSIRLDESRVPSV
jgi:hypothetical protein